MVVVTQYRYNNKTIKEVKTDSFFMVHTKEKITIENINYIIIGLYRKYSENSQIIEIIKEAT